MDRVPYASPFCAGLSSPYIIGQDYDPTACGVRDKPRRYREIMAHWLNQTAMMFEWTLPDELQAVPPHFVEQCLQVYGWGALICPSTGWAFVSGFCANWDGKYTPYYQPDGIIVANPYATGWNGTYTFDDDAYLCRNDPVFAGLLPVLSARVEMQTETDVTIINALQNLRLINLIHAQDDAAEQAAKLAMRELRAGRQSIVTGASKSRWYDGSEIPPVEMMPISGVPANYLQQMIEMCQYIRGSTFNDLGLQANWNAKREALNDSEVNAGNDTLRPLVDIMLKCREEFCEQVRNTAGLEISVKLSGAWADRAEVAAAVVDQITGTGPAEEEPPEDEKGDAGGGDPE